MTNKQLHSTTVTSRAIGWITHSGLAIAIVLVGFVATARAEDELNTSTGLTIVGAPLAIHGYDPVAYFTESRARVGKAVFTATHQGAAYRFVTEANTLWPARASVSAVSRPKPVDAPVMRIVFVMVSLLSNRVHVSSDTALLRIVLQF